MTSYKERSAFDRLNRLYWLKSQGCDFTFDVDQIIEELRGDAPDWKPEYGKSAADDYTARSGWVQTEKRHDELANIALIDLIARAKELSGRRGDFLVEYDPFAGLSESRPVRALAALRTSWKNGNFHPDYWQKFFDVESRKTDSERMKLLIASRLSDLSSSDFSQVSFSVARWFEKASGVISVESPVLFSSIWTKLIGDLGTNENSNRSALIRQSNDVDWTTEAMNSVAGELGELHVNLLIERKPNQKDGLPLEWKNRANELLSLPYPSRQYSLVLLSHQLGWLFSLDQSWTEGALLDPIDQDADSADSQAIWAGFFWGTRTPHAPLFKRLKPHFLSMARATPGRTKRHGEILGGILLAGWAYENGGKRLISSDELHNVILDAEESFRSHLIWQLSRWSKDDAWADRIVVFLSEVWPKQKKTRTPSISAHLADLAIGLEDRFPEVVAAILPLLGRADPHSFAAYRLQKEDSNIVGKYPTEALDLLFAILPEDASIWPHGAHSLVRDLLKSQPTLKDNPKLFQLLSRLDGV
ncbi:hypothetical protein JYU02_01495 [bacterium AH-315-P15]|nr:hypothetical protein [bacterium AH-315-P15]